MKNQSFQRRSGFTLIELLMVTAIIGILVGATFGLFKAASTARTKAKAKGEMQGMIMAAENFKKNYGDYPCARSSTTDDYRIDFYDQIMGRKVLKSSPITTGGSSLKLLNYNDNTLPGSGNRKQKPFLTSGDVPSNDDTKFSDLAARLEFRDPWDNPYDYRYRILNGSNSITDPSTGKLNAPYANWKSSNFLLVSCGGNYAEPTGSAPDLEEYWDPSAVAASTMEKCGMIPASYFDQPSTTGPYRADNIVNWQNN
jgi:prepilin-type N-terminal cleavage/methylation domain-containing protein